MLPARSPRILDIAAAIVVVLFLFSGILTLNRYGISWDEGAGNMFFGERYLQFLAHPDFALFDFFDRADYHNEVPLDLFSHSSYRENPREFPALADILSAGTMYLFAYRLNWLGPVEGFHLFSVLISAVLLACLYAFAARRFDRITALLAIILLACFPRFWADMHFNPKDVPETAFFSMAIMSYAWWYRAPTVKKALLFGLLFGCAVAIKANSLLIPFICVLGVWDWLRRPRGWLDHMTHLKQRVVQYALMAATAGAVVFLSWPLLYQHPSYLLKYYDYIIEQGGRTVASGFSSQPLRIALATMPEFFLAALALGVTTAVVALVTRKNHYLSYQLALAWMALPILRASLPYAVNFDGIRHYLEFVPAAVLLAAAGVVALARFAARRMSGIRWAPAVVALALAAAFIANTAAITTRYFPYLHIYFNTLAGGQVGAARIFGPDEATDYWGVSYREGMAWMNANLPQGSIVYASIAGWTVREAQPLWLRDDLRMVSKDQIAGEQAAGNDIYAMFISRDGFYSDLERELLATRQPLHTIEVAGYPILYIFRIE